MGHTATPYPLLPGRLGNPTMTLRDDPRADPRMLAAMAPLGLADAPPESPVDSRASLAELLAFCEAAEPGWEELQDYFMRNLPPVEGVEIDEFKIAGFAGNEIQLLVHRQEGVTESQPCILHLHGGGMALMSARNSLYDRWRSELAVAGLVVVGVEFRNAAGKHGPFAFPAGLDDCMTALRWVVDNKSQLGINGVVVSGESGGGNLSLATALRAKREGTISDIAGVYAQCPLVSNRYVDKDLSLASLFENDTYGLSCEMIGVMSKVYDPSGDNATNPLAWPLYAECADLEGLPPHMISVNQLDPLRDEGLAYFRKLLSAGVTASCRTINGTNHAAEMLFRSSMPDVYLATIHDIKGFADRNCHNTRSGGIVRGN